MPFTVQTMSNRTLLTLASASGGRGNVCRVGDMHRGEGGRGVAVTLDVGAPVTFILDGLSSASVVLRDASDDALALEVNSRNFEHLNPVSMYAPTGHPEWSLSWCFNDDATLSPVVPTAKAAHDGLVLGWDPTQSHKPLCLVQKRDPHRLVFRVTPAMAGAAPRRPADPDAILSVVAPPCVYLGSGRKAVGMQGQLYVLKQHNGRGQQLHICSIDDVRARVCSRQPFSASLCRLSRRHR